MFQRIQSGLLALAMGLLLAVGLCLALANSASRVPVAHGQPTSLSFVDDDGDPLVGANVRVLCYATGDIAPSNPQLADLLVLTNEAGQAAPGLPAGCNYVAALWQRYTQPSGKPDHGPAYWVYATSWSPFTPTLASAASQVTISLSNTLVLFNIVTSLGWEPAPGSDYVSELREGFRQASAYLYDLTDGQMAFGPVRIFAGGHQWDEADFRVLAANDYRPTAFIGGIVQARDVYSLSKAVTDTYLAPGEIYLGRFWERTGTSSDPSAGAWDQADASRTLVHEWGHYALFLYDEYILLGGQSTFCTTSNLPYETDDGTKASAMSWHYTTSEWWSEADGWPADCLDTDQHVVHGEQDWPALSRWSSIQGLPQEWLMAPFDPGPGPDDLGLVASLFGRWPAPSLYLPHVLREGTPIAVASEPVIHLKIANAQPDPLVREALYPQVYTVVSTTAASSVHLLHQGTSGADRTSADDLGQITLFGVRPADQAPVFVDYYAKSDAQGARFLYPAPGEVGLPLADGQTLTVVTDTWKASLDITYEVTDVVLTAMTMTLTSPTTLSTPPSVQLCTSDIGTGCPADWRKDMTLLGEGAPGQTWLAAFTASDLAGEELPHYGFVRVEAPGVGEVIRTFQLAGGVGPAHSEGNAPLLDGPVTVGAEVVTATAGTSLGFNQPGVGQAVSYRGSQVVFMPAADYAAISATLPISVEGMVGVPLDLDIVMPAGISGTFRLTLYYNQEVMDRLARWGITEDQLVLLYFDRGASRWTRLATAGQSTELNWLSALVSVDGIYGVGWAAPIPSFSLAGLT